MRALAARGLAVALMALAVTAQAAQPMATEDADAKPARECEWETSASRARSADSTPTTVWTTQLGCGVGLDSEIALGLGRIKGGGESTDIWSLSGKTSLRERSESSAGLALFWGLLADKSARAQSWLASAVASQAVAKDWVLHANLGGTRDRALRRTRAYWALGVEHALHGSIDLTGETFGVGSDDPAVALGLRWTPHQRFVVGLSWTHDLSPQRCRTLALVTTLGF